MTHKMLKINNLQILIFWHKIAYNVYKTSIMDTKISRKTNKKKYLLIALPIILIFGYIVFTSATKKRSLTIKAAEITVKTVENDFFEDFMSFQAKAVPLNSMLISHKNELDLLTKFDAGLACNPVLFVTVTPATLISVLVSAVTIVVVFVSGSLFPLLVLL